MRKRWGWLFLSVVLGGLLGVKTAVSQPAALHAVLFVSPTCGHCHYVLDEVLPPLLAAHQERLAILVVDVTEPVGSELYRQTIVYYNIPHDRQGVPTLVVGELVLVGSGEIAEQLPPLAVAGSAEWPSIPGLAALLPTPPAGGMPAPVATATVVPTVVEAREVGGETAVYLAYFYDPTCLDCARVSQELVQLQAQYPHLVVAEFDLRAEAALNEALGERYGVPVAQRLLAPAIFIGSHSLIADEISVAVLQRHIENPEPAALVPPWAQPTIDPETATAQIVARFEQFGLLAVMGAGLLDGVNPCAFTTIIFFVSYLALVGRKGREVLWVGAAFTLAVFLTYLGLGLGLTELLRRLQGLTVVSQVIYGLTAVVCLVLACLSVSDYLKIRRGQLKEITLQLPQALKKRIHHTIRQRSRTVRGYVGAAFIAGVLVSFFELACTGQVYLPTLVFVTQTAVVRPAAIGYLVLYNLMFVVPLLAVFAGAYFGTSSKQLATLFQAYAGQVKLLTALLFVTLGVWLGYWVMTTV